MTTETMNRTFYDFELESIDGARLKLEDYRNKLVLVVNVASRCGFTSQYADLQQLYEKYKESGLVVLGVPSNDFLYQEPGSNEEIKAFCESKFHVTFPMSEKIAVRGKKQHPLYSWLTASHGRVTWNFNKFLIGKTGQILGHFSSNDAPLRGELEVMIAKHLDQ